MNITKKVILGSGITLTTAALCYKNNNNNKYTYSEVSKHTSEKDGIWVTYKDSIYDITNFISSHPGGKDKILLAAGKGVEPYWNVYKQHNNTDISNFLRDLKIGTLKDYDPDKYSNFIDPYVSDPMRDSNLIFHSITPCNAELPSYYITDSWITPNNMWYIRNHNPVPEIDLNKYQLKISGLSKKPG